MNVFLSFIQYGLKFYAHKFKIKPLSGNLRKSDNRKEDLEKSVRRSHQRGFGYEKFIVSIYVLVLRLLLLITIQM